MLERALQAGDLARFRSINDLDDNLSPSTLIECCPVSTVRISSLIFMDSPRLEGEDPEHTRLLADADNDLPPITVHRSTMRVIDGVHRVQAAVLNGRRTIDARLLDCDEEIAFVLAVAANVRHGLPLSQSDRKAAAARIIASHPQWSDRAIAVSTGLSNKTVSAIRDCSTGETPQLNARLGRDGRLHPLSTAAKRRQAAALISNKPEAGLREIARATGLSPATVRDVRQRTDRGEDPVPARFRTVPNDQPKAEPRSTHKPPSRRRTRPREVQVDQNMLLASLRSDPCLKFSEAGRHTLRWLHHHTVDSDSLEAVGLSVPNHWLPVIADLARSCARAWTTLAEQLEQRAHGDAS